MTNLLKTLLGASYATSLGGIVSILCGTGLLVAAMYHPDRWETLSTQAIGLIAVGASAMRARANNVTSEQQAKDPGYISAPPPLSPVGVPPTGTEIPYNYRATEHPQSDKN